ncbi:MAG: argininosuccinate lyase [Acidobacteria bacterium]|nr:MAG: argininosuccinate lyase [Acidobacteriota bacterium]
MTVKDSHTNPWGGRFQSETDPLVRRYTGSLDLDRRLAAYDIKGSRAHVRMLADQGILHPEDAGQIEKGLDQIEAEISGGTFPYRDELEDIHMNIERRLQEIVGPAGGKVHTGRSRNDQVALDLKLFCLEVAGDWRDKIRVVQQTFVERAGQLETELYPGWTHLQAAQPMSWAHYLLAFVEMFERDRRRLASYSDLHDVSPLGAGALAGSTLPLDPAKTAHSMGFKEAFRNSYDVVGDRDFILELLQIASQIMIHASRLAEDFVYMSSTAVGWIELPDALCTGSSMMPQKKNPDVMELARGKTATVLGHATGLAALLKGLPSSYNRDLQQDKEHLFPAVAITGDTLEVLPLVVAGFQVRTGRIALLLREGFLMATDLAEYLVRRGMPFRTAHEKVGRLVATCVSEGVRLDELPIERIRSLIPECGEDVGAVLAPAAVLQNRRHAGSTGLESIRGQLDYWKQRLQGEKRE